MELVVKATYDKKSERWYVDTDEATVEAMNSFLKEHDLNVFESWLGYLEDGMSSEALAFVDLLQTTEDEIELADGSKIKLVEGQKIMKVYNAIGTVYHTLGRLRGKELIGSFSTLEQARNAVSQVASNYDEVGIVVTELDKVEIKEL